MVFIYSQFPQKVGLLGFRYDYFSCPQLEGKNSFALAGKNSFGEEVGSEQASAISSIPAYIARCQFFLALCPTLGGQGAFDDDVGTTGLVPDRARGT